VANDAANTDRLVSAINRTLSLGAEALAALIGGLDQPFLDAIALLRGRKHLVITTGVGKSGLIARKLAATLTSTGTPAIFLDPLNALHGDLGIVSPGDVVIGFSNSGETQELLALFPALNQRQVPMVAIVGRANSTLEQQAAVTLLGKIAQEACPLNLAPTTSTTVAMVLGDALAIGLMIASDYRAEDFALNHPAGSLGRRLTLRISDLLRGTIEDQTIAADAGFIDVVCRISQSGAGAVCVTDEDGKLEGIITDGDIRRAVQALPPHELAAARAAAIMTVKPICARFAMLAADALDLMENRPSQIAVLPVIDENDRFRGIIRLHDLILAGL